jgi:uridine phosphorylase
MMPHHLGDVSTSARAAIVTGDPDRVPALAEALGTPATTWSRRGFVCTETSQNGERVLIASTGIGGPATAIAAEELWQVGIRQIIRVGTCGAMQPQVRPGSLVVSSGAIRDDGTSHQYLPPSVPAVPDSALLASLVAEAKARGIAHHVGLTHTKDAYYAERPEGLPLRGEWEAKWAMLRSIGVLATEMEAATLFAVATVRRFQAAALLVPVDRTISAADVLSSLRAAALIASVGALAIGETAAYPVKEETQ